MFEQYIKSFYTAFQNIQVYEELLAREVIESVIEKISLEYNLPLATLRDKYTKKVIKEVIGDQKAYFADCKCKAKCNNGKQCVRWATVNGFCIGHQGKATRRKTVSELNQRRLEIEMDKHDRRAQEHAIIKQVKKEDDTKNSEVHKGKLNVDPKVKVESERISKKSLSEQNGITHSTRDLRPRPARANNDGRSLPTPPLRRKFLI